MAALSHSDRQAVIDDYMAATGVEKVVPAAFIEWLRPQHNHAAHGFFFAKSDSEAAAAYREALFRRFVNGLQIKVSEERIERKTHQVRVVTAEYPALVSFGSGRRAGGGYTPFDPSSPGDLAELERQARVALLSWLHRYGAVMRKAGVDLTPIEKIAAAPADRVARLA